MASKLLRAAALALPAVTSALPQAGVNSNQIVGGEPAEAGEFPYIVSLSSGGSHFCGGSLLNANTVITAAHCSGFTPEQVQVRAGTLTWASGGVQVGVSSILSHPDYTGATTGNDVAIWKLATPILAGNSTGYATLPELGFDPAAGDLVVTAGWGDLQSGAGQGSAELMKVEVPVVSRDQCNEEYPGQITETMFCAAEEEGGQDSCQGDSGGPIVAADGTLIGLVSWGRGCALPDFSGVYVNLGAVVDFVNENL